MSELFDHQSKLEMIPHEPGCYIMKDKRGQIVYIGKAKDLKNRVRNYFQPSGDHRAFVKKLPGLLSDIETIITASEKEALILENTLIKLHKPRFNVALKDDKSYLSLAVKVDHDWPWVEVVRKTENVEGRIFGPYSSSYAVRRTLKVLNKYFQLRTCPDSVLSNRDRPCLQYQIKRCPAPCVFDLDRDEYMEHVQRAILFLEGRGEELIGELENKMIEASEQMEFELAANFRDQIQAIEKVLESQRVVTNERIDRDAFGFYREGDRVLIQVLFVRNGKLEGAKSFPYSDQEFGDDEILSSFINLFYNSGNFIPKEVLLPMSLGESQMEAFEELLGELKDERVYLLEPKRGPKRALVDTAQTNAEHSFEEEHRLEERNQDILEKLQQRLGLRNFPKRMECYDISNLQGKQIVASMVVFIDGEPSKSDYRRYKIRDVTSQDDFASMHEVLSRRFGRVVDGRDDPPELVVIDGGKGQLGQAEAVLEDFGLHEVDLISLAKGRVDRSGFDDEEVTRSPERVFLPGRKNPVVLRQNSAEIYLLQRIRDEAHRWAITYHKKLRRKSGLRSSLDEIPGVGPKTKRELLKHFGSLRAIREADVETLSEVSNIGPRLAETIVEFFAALDTMELERGG